MLVQLGWPRNELTEFAPIVWARELLLSSWKLYSSDPNGNGVQNSRVAIFTAMKALAFALNAGGTTEVMHGGRRVDALDALMWYGICAGLLLPPDGVLGLGPDIPRPLALSDQSDVMSLDVARSRYEDEGDFRRAGRCSHEVAEILRIRGNATSSSWFDRAASLFDRGRESDRAAAARQSKSMARRESSPFFHRAVGPGPTTVAGSLEYSTMAPRTLLGV